MALNVITQALHGQWAGKEMTGKSDRGQLLCKVIIVTGYSASEWRAINTI